MLDTHLPYIHTQIATLERGTEFGLKDLFGNRWKDIKQPTFFGQQFKEAVLAGIIRDIESIGIASSGRYDVYRKV